MYSSILNGLISRFSVFTSNINQTGVFDAQTVFFLALKADLLMVESCRCGIKPTTSECLDSYLRRSCVSWSRLKRRESL